MVVVNYKRRQRNVFAGYYFLDYLDIVVIVEGGAIAIACTNFYFSASTQN